MILQWYFQLKKLYGRRNIYFSDLLTVPKEPGIRSFEQRKFDTQFYQSLDIKIEMAIIEFLFSKKEECIRFLAYNCADESFVYQRGFSRAWGIFKSSHFYIWIEKTALHPFHMPFLESKVPISSLEKESSHVSCLLVT